MSTQQNEVLNTIFRRRSIRAFTQDPVDRESVETILQAGRWAPSGLNNQPWRFMVLCAGDSRQEGLAECTRYGGIVRKARVLIPVCIDKASMYSATKDHQSIGACMQNMLLAVHSLGLGGVWLGEILNREEQALNVLGLDNEAYGLMAVLALGHPAEEGTSDRKPMQELILQEW